MPPRLRRAANLYFYRTALDNVPHRVFLQNHRVGRLRWVGQGKGLCRVCGVCTVGAFGLSPGCVGSGRVRQAVVSVSDEAVGVWSAVSERPHVKGRSAESAACGC
jgi:hypothetical protein